MKSIRSMGLVLIIAGALATSGPTWAAGHLAHRSPVLAGISGGFLSSLSGLWDSVRAGFQTLLEEGDPATLDQEKGGKEPTPEQTPQEAPLPPPPPPVDGGGCIDPNGGCK